MDLKSGVGEQPVSQDQVAPLFCFLLSHCFAVLP